VYKKIKDQVEEGKKYHQKLYHSKVNYQYVMNYIVLGTWDRWGGPNKDQRNAIDWALRKKINPFVFYSKVSYIGGLIDKISFNDFTPDELNKILDAIISHKEGSWLNVRHIKPQTLIDLKDYPKDTIVRMLEMSLAPEFPFNEDTNRMIGMLPIANGKMLTDVANKLTKEQITAVEEYFASHVDIEPNKDYGNQFTLPNRDRETISRVYYQQGILPLLFRHSRQIMDHLAKCSKKNSGGWGDFKYWRERNWSYGKLLEPRLSTGNYYY